MKKEINKFLLSFEKLDKDDMQTILEIENNQGIKILSKKSILSELNSTSSFYFITKYDEEIVGYINYYLSIDTIDLNSIVVKKEFQNLGIATFMLNNLIQIAKENNIKNIMLEVRKSNIKAKNLYNKFNFIHIHTRKNYYNDLEDAEIFKLNIK